MVTIEETIFIRAPIQRCFDLARSVEVHVLGNIHFQESATAVGGRTTGLLPRVWPGYGGRPRRSAVPRRRGRQRCEGVKCEG